MQKLVDYPDAVEQTHWLRLSVAEAVEDVEEMKCRKKERKEVEGGKRTDEFLLELRLDLTQKGKAREKKGHSQRRKDLGKGKERGSWDRGCLCLHWIEIEENMERREETEFKDSIFQFLKKSLSFRGPQFDWQTVCHFAK